MNDFTASNGVIVREHPGAIGVRRSVEDLTPVPVPGFTRPVRVQTYLDPRQWDAIAEAVQAEADERLGRWRWPADPDFIVYETREHHAARVLRESTGQALDYLRSEPRVFHPSAFGAAAYAYFDAHPEPKPWHDAQPGEVWELAFSHEGGGGIEPFTVDRAGKFRHPNYVGGVSLADSEITAGRRIWPEVQS